MNEVLELKHLKKYYNDIRGIDDISLKLKKGDIYGFIGPNGAGKSTTIRTIMGLINKTDGLVLFKGKELNTDDPSIKKMIGYLPSEIHLYGDMTVKELFDYHESFFSENLSLRRKELIKSFKIDESKRIDSLSLGNLKKVGIVLAFMHSPELLILDEPTSGLDPMMQKIFHNLLLEEKEKGTTILYSSHILSEVSLVSNRIGFIKDGKIIKEDTIDNIRKDHYTYLTISSPDISKIKKELKLTVKKENDNEITFINNIDYNSLIKKLTNYDIQKILIENVSLEDLFEDYYK